LSEEVSMKCMLVSSLLIILVSCTMLACRERNTIIKAFVDTDSRIHVQYNIPEKENLAMVKLYRSYINFNELDSIDIYQNAIAAMPLPVNSFKGEVIDSFVASDVQYYYYLAVKTKSGTTYACNVDSGSINQMILGSTCGSNFNIVIDKLHYILEARCGNRVMKRYPVNLGRNPVSRKLCGDDLTTPEGDYFVPYVKDVSKFHKAFGINYPNKDDIKRYAEALKNNRVPFRGQKPAWIGGAIQIHGGGIGYQNWTWGCIAMRNYDIDELFSLKKNLVGTPVRIVGSEIKRLNNEH
jgi:hypothetical protein